MRYLLDTDACVDLLKGRYPLMSDRVRHSPPEDICLNTIVVAELRYGADRSSDPRRTHESLEAFLGGIRCLDFDFEAAAVYGKVRSVLEAEGSVIGPYDMLIAAQAISRGLVLVTGNEREFRRVAGLQVENWRN